MGPLSACHAAERHLVMPRETFSASESMSPARITGLISWIMAIGAGIAVSQRWFGVATTLALASVLAMLEAFGDALGETLEKYLGREHEGE